MKRGLALAVLSVMAGQWVLDSTHSLLLGLLALAAVAAAGWRWSLQ